LFIYVSKNMARGRKFQLKRHRNYRQEKEEPKEQLRGCG
jgi:hypothetical protein